MILRTAFAFTLFALGANCNSYQGFSSASVGPAFFEELGLLDFTPASAKNVYACPDAVHTSRAINTFRGVFGYDSLQWDELLVGVAMEGLQDSEAVCGQTNWQPKYNGTYASFGFAYFAKNDFVSYKCVRAINWWYSIGPSINHTSLQNEISIEDQDNVDLLSFAALLWKDAESVGCAIKDCSPEHHNEYAVMCHVSRLPDFQRPLKRSLMAKNTPRQSDVQRVRCPVVNQTDTERGFGPLISSEEFRRLHLTLQRLSCYHGQLMGGDMQQEGVPFALPCRHTAVPPSCMEWETKVALSQLTDDVGDVSCPTAFISNPRTNTLEDIAELYNANLESINATLSGDTALLTASALCCYNPLIKLRGSCTQPLPPLQQQQSYVVVPCPNTMKFRSCEEERPIGYAAVTGVYSCPDAEDTVTARRDVRSVMGLSHPQWNKTIEAALKEELLSKFDKNCNNLEDPVVSAQSNTMLQQPSWAESLLTLRQTLWGPFAQMRCAGAAMGFELIAQTVADAALSDELPDEVLDGSSSWAGDVYAALTSSRSSSFACVLQACDVYHVNVICMYNVERNETEDWWELTQPFNETSCVRPYWAMPGDTYNTIAAANNITPQELMCFHQQAATPHDAKVRWTTGTPMAIPCPADNPEQISCEAFELSRGMCNIRYTAQLGDSFDNIATLWSAQRQRLTGCHICMYNNRADPQDCDLQLMEEIVIPCRENITDEIKDVCDEKECEYTVSWGFDGDEFDVAGRMSDWSWSGYHNGRSAVPNTTIAGDNVKYVKKYGAQGDTKIRGPNDWRGTDDFASIRNALDAAADGDVMYFDAGIYTVSQNITISKRVILKGAGVGKTILYFPNSLSDLYPLDSNPDEEPTRDEARRFSFGPGMILFRGSDSVNISSLLATISRNAKKGDYWLEVDSVERIKKGEWIRIVASDFPKGHKYSGQLIAALYGGFEDPAHYFLGVKGSSLLGARHAMQFMSPVKEVKKDQSKIQLERPLPYGLDVVKFKAVEVHRFSPSVQEVGVEDMTIRYRGEVYGGHHSEAGFNGIQMDRVANCWIRNVDIINSDSSFRLNNAHFCTLQNISVSADYPRPRETTAFSEIDNYGHHGVVISRGTSNVVQGYQINARQVHDIGIDNYASLNVIKDVNGSIINLDHHRSAPHCNLFVNISVGNNSRIWYSGGAQGRGPHAGTSNVYWGIRAQQFFNLPPQDFGPYLTFVGVEVNFNQLFRSNPYNWLVENIHPDMLCPADLHSAMFDRRLQLEAQSH